MQTRLVLLTVVMVLDAGCKSVDCGEGTTERDGVCVAADQTVGRAQCGPFTELQGDTCTPILPPTVCDPATTVADVDDQGVTTCIGTGAGGGCSAPLACPAPTDGKQTICGQLFELETNTPFAAPGANGTPCTAAAASGPCAIGVRAYDAVAFAMNPSTAPLTTGPVHVDDCGRYRISEIPVPGTGFIAVAVDDAVQGPGGLTNATGVATPAAMNTATKDLEAFIVPGATTTAWATSGGPTIEMGYYVPIYRGHRTGTDLVAGVTVTYGAMTMPPPATTDLARDFYFAADAAARTTLNAVADLTGINGTALFSGANLGELYSGQGALPAECRWSIHAGASTPGVVFIQIFRPINNGPMTCPL
jgi:hypothetical protein